MPLDQPGFQWHHSSIKDCFGKLPLVAQLNGGNFCNKARRIHFGIYEHAWYHWLLSPMGVGSQGPVHSGWICVELGSCFFGVKCHYPFFVPCWGRCKLSTRRVNPSSIKQQNGNMYVYVYSFCFIFVWQKGTHIVSIPRQRWHCALRKPKPEVAWWDSRWFKGPW